MKSKIGITNKTEFILHCVGFYIEPSMLVLELYLLDNMERILFEF